MMNFWWGQKCSEHRIHWIRREELVCPKIEGGMGFRDLRGFNTALLEKQVWTHYQRPDSLAARILRAKYHKHSSILEAEVGYRPSFIWHNLMSAQDFLWNGMRWRIGSGSTVRIWGDKWIPSLPDCFVTSSPIQLAITAIVRELVDPLCEQWNVALLERSFPAAITEAIVKIPLHGNGETDCIIWHGSNNGQYSSRSGYEAWLTNLRAKHSLPVVGIVLAGTDSGR
ncbi:Uncharacterized mitochondrial protein AtMg00310 [Linum grandiflorum]